MIAQLTACCHPPVAVRRWFQHLRGCCCFQHSLSRNPSCTQCHQRHFSRGKASRPRSAQHERAVGVLLLYCASLSITQTQRLAAPPQAWVGAEGAVQPQCVHHLFSHQPKAFTAAYMPPPQPCSICHRQEPSFAAETHHHLHPLIATYSFPAQQLHLAGVCVQVVGSAHPRPVPGTPLLQPSQQQMALMMLTKRRTQTPLTLAV